MWEHIDIRHTFFSSRFTTHTWVKDNLLDLNKVTVDVHAMPFTDMLKPSNKVRADGSQEDVFVKSEFSVSSMGIINRFAYYAVVRPRVGW